MGSKETHLEFKVGGFVIVAFICLTVFIFSIGDSSSFQRGETYRVVFDFANGLKVSAPVCIAGVETGLVKNITVFYDIVDGKTKVEVLIWVKEKQRIPVSSRVLINQLGLFGEKYIEIIPGKRQDRFYAVQDTIVGQNPVMQEDIAQKVLAVADQVETSVGGINRILTDEENQHSIKNILAKVSSTSERFDRLVGKLESGQGTIGKLLSDAELYDDLKMMATDLKANPWKLLYRPPAEKKKR